MRGALADVRVWTGDEELGAPRVFCAEAAGATIAVSRATGVSASHQEGPMTDITQGLYLGRFVLATIAVPIVMYGLMPRLHRLRARLVVSQPAR